MYKAYVFRMYPNDKQKQLINQSIGNARFVYNYFLNQKIEDYKNTKKTQSCFDQIKELPILYKEYPFLKEGDSCALRNSLFNLEDSYKRFFNKQSNYPRFKKKGINDSYKTNNIKSSYKGNNYESIKLDLVNKVITLPKLKEIKIRGYRNVDKIIGDIKSATIKKEANRYYVSVLVEEEYIKPIFVPNHIVGIDLGIKDTIITSYNEKIENKFKNDNIKKRIKGLSRALARAKVGSHNRYKIKLKIQRCYQKLKNMRKYLIHDITNKLTNENDIIITEDLDIKNMYKNHTIAKSLTDIPLGNLLQTLEYKCELKNKKLIKIDRYYPSSQICSKCNYQNKKLKDLSIRVWECPECHTTHDRDYNAAENILFEGLKQYMRTIEV